MRNGLDDVTLLELFSWSAEDFNQRLEGSPIRRIGHERWLRNIAVALGNALTNVATKDAAKRIIASLEKRKDHPSAMLREHILWALERVPAEFSH